MDVQMMPMWMRFTLWVLAALCLIAAGLCGDMDLVMTTRALKQAALALAFVSVLDLLIAFLVAILSPPGLAVREYLKETSNAQ